MSILQLKDVTFSYENVIDILVKLAHEKNYCVIIVTHDMGILDKVDVVYRMKDGSLEENCEEK